RAVRAVPQGGRRQERLLPQRPAALADPIDRPAGERHPGLEMKTVFNFIFALGLGAMLAAPARAEGPSTLERLASLVDYVAADYPGAVKDGKVIAEAEFKEQQTTVAEAQTLAREVRPSKGHEAAQALL